eukprot:5283811-Prymnesium_polylepis.1
MLHGGNVVLMGTYGRRLEPVRYVLWLHSSPSLACMISESRDAPPGATSLRLYRLVVAIMVTGFVATAKVPPLITRFGFVGEWGWRIAWLLISCYAHVQALVIICHTIWSAFSVSNVRRIGLCAVIIITWNNFALVWFLGQSGLVSEAEEAQFYEWSDLFAKMLASVAIANGVKASTENRMRSKSKEQLKHESSRTSALRAFARSTGHDLRTPLQALTYFGHMMQGTVADLINEFANHEAELSKLHSLHEQVVQTKACTHMLSLIVSNLWELDSQTQDSAPVSMLPPPQEETTELKEQITAMLELLKASPTAKSHVRIQSIVDDRIPPVRCDTARLLRSLLNLLVNALKFTERGA